jgi:hypothetical protein
VAWDVYLQTPDYASLGVPGAGIPVTLIPGTHVMTARVPGATLDSVLVVLRGDSVIAYDDDNGPGLMSWLHLNSACPADAPCTFFVGNILNAKSVGFQAVPLPPVNNYVYLLWDEDVHNGRDSDHDGLGDALEVALGTDPNLRDTDGDGISDGAETLGLADDPKHESTYKNLLLFPDYGASPLTKDIFVEADWVPACLDKDPLCGQPPVAGGIDKLAYQYTAPQVDIIRSMFVRDPSSEGSDFKIHIDTGDPTCTPPEVCGDWGGAQMYPDGQNPSLTFTYCDGLSPSRVGYFHHIYSDPASGSQTKPQLLMNGFAFLGALLCSKTSNDGSSGARNTAHEIGHQFGLQHYGGYDAADQMNGCKPNYMSIMTYGYTMDGDLGSLVPGFSRGDNLGIVLNAAALDETLWPEFSPNSQTVIANAFGRKTSASGIDWNMDGHISTADEQALNGLPKGPLNYEPTYTGCDRAAFATRQGAYLLPGRYPSLVVENDALWLLAHNADLPFFGSVLFVGRADTSGCKNKGWLNCTSWTGYPLVHLNPAPGAFAPAAGGDVIVYATGDETKGGDLYYMTQPPWQQTPSSWKPSAPAKVGGPKIWGHPVAIVDPAIKAVSIYAAGTSDPAPSADTPRYLMRWEYNSASKSWTRLGETQVDASGSPIQIDYTTGPAITRGYQSGGLLPNEIQQEQVYILVQTAGSSGSQLKMFRQVGMDWLGNMLYWLFGILNLGLPQYWTELPSALWADLAMSLSGGTTVNVSDGRLGLAFRPEPQPTDAGGFVSGRFYITFLGKGWYGPDQLHEPFVSLTQGNIFWDGTGARPAERAMTFLTFNNFYNDWADISGVPLVYFDGNVRGTAQMDWDPKYIKEKFDPNQKAFGPPNVSFFPNADGVVNGDQHDYNDQALIEKNLACSLRRLCQ